MSTTSAGATRKEPIVIGLIVMIILGVATSVVLRRRAHRRPALAWTGASR